MSDWEERAARAIERHDDGVARLPEDGDERQRQLTRMGNAAWAAGLSLLMAGRDEEGREWLLRAAERYRESWPLAPSGSWGRPIGAMKSRLIAGDREGALEDAAWALEAGAAESESPIGRYAAVLAHLVRGDDAEAAGLASALVGRDDFPATVADTLVTLAAGDAAATSARSARCSPTSRRGRVPRGHSCRRHRARAPSRSRHERGLAVDARLAAAPGMSDNRPVLPETRYARSGDVSIAYQVTGDGPFDLVYVPPFVSHVELAWEIPAMTAFFDGLASFSRLIRFDKRGQGMSDRVSGARDARDTHGRRPGGDGCRGIGARGAARAFRRAAR